MKDLELLYECIATPQQDLDSKLEKAFEIIFSEIKKAADLESQRPQSPVRAGEVNKANGIERHDYSAS